MPFSKSQSQTKPRPGQRVKGFGSPVWQGSNYRYDPAEGILFREDNYIGPATSIASKSLQYRASKIGHTAETNNGIGHLTTRVPVQSDAGNDVDVRYELVSEFIEKDLFSHPAVSAAAIVYDAAIGAEGDTTFRKTAENAVETQLPSGMGNTVGNQVIKHLKNGITGYERENLIIRRYRKAPGNNPLGWQASILDGKYIYSTEQLGLPNDLAFQLPDLGAFPVSISGEVQWGWRRRPTTNVWTREYIEQSSEFVLAEWSLLLYEVASGEAGW